MVSAEQVMALLMSAEMEGNDALAAYKSAAKHVAECRAAMYEERSTDSGATMFVPLERLAKELLESADVPDSAMPGGRGGTAEERKAARERWCMKHVPLYREYTAQLEDAEFRIKLAEGELMVAERAAARSNSKFGAAKAALEFLTAVQLHETEKLKLQQ